jgi:hypothetical protein
MFRADGEDIAASVRVRHVRAETSDSGERTFLIGLEFMAAPPVLLERIDKWLLESQGGGMAAMEG